MTEDTVTMPTLVAPQPQRTKGANSLPTQQGQALLALFPKFFSSFPHGTCILSASSTYPALRGMHHPICISCSRNVILMMCTVDRQPQVAHRILTLTDALAQEAYNWGTVGAHRVFTKQSHKPGFP